MNTLWEFFTGMAAITESYARPVRFEDWSGSVQTRPGPSHGPEAPPPVQAAKGSRTVNSLP
jgi:hypothetical protein